VINTFALQMNFNLKNSFLIVDLLIGNLHLYQSSYPIHVAQNIGIDISGVFFHPSETCQPDECERPTISVGKRLNQGTATAHVRCNRFGVLHADLLVSDLLEILLVAFGRINPMYHRWSPDAPSYGSEFLRTISLHLELILFFLISW